MLAKVSAFIDKYNLLNTGDKVVVACSGGPDSLALLHLLYTLRKDYNLMLVAAHVDHMFRGAESAREAQAVTDYCASLGITCYVKAINVPQYIAHSGRSGQDAARYLRYQYLRKVAQKLGGAKIATGHHRDDQAETVLLHLLRGSGSAGLGGMQPMSAGLIRPLLSVTRAEIEDYVRMWGLVPNYDSSNAKTDYLRNKVRLKLLPLLEQEYNPNIKEMLCRTAEIVSDEHDFIRQQAEKIWPQVMSEKDDFLYLNIKMFASLHRALQREIFRLAITKKQGNLTGITFYHVEKLIETTLAKGVGTVFKLPGELAVWKGYTELKLGRFVPETNKTGLMPEIQLTVPGSTYVPKFKATVTTAFIPRGARVQAANNQAVFDFAQLKLPLSVRTRRPGDWFVPLGMKGRKKLKDFFIDAKVPRSERDKVLLICDRQSILWLSGYRQSERAKVTDDTKELLQITITKQEDALRE